MNLSTKVLEAGGSIEQRASYADYSKFVDKYVFTKEQLEKFMNSLNKQVDGIVDLAKTKHCIELLIDLENRRAT
jgi:hypothetical protein